MSGWERELIWRQKRRPAVRLDRAGALSAKSSLEEQKQRDSQARGNGCRTHRKKTVISAEYQQQGAQGIPQPAVATSGRKKHPQTDPARRTPCVHPIHHTVVPGLDVIQNMLSN
jgi:hypothetical protein